MALPPRLRLLLQARDHQLLLLTFLCPTSLSLSSFVHQNIIMWTLTSLLFCLLAVTIAAHGTRRLKKFRKYEKIRFFFELNHSHGDLGVQLLLLPGTDWKDLKIYFPNGKQMLELESSNALRTQGVSELFFESAEPPFEDVSKATVLRRFPEGKYKFFADTLKGLDLLGYATLSHKFPDPPEITNPIGAEDPPRTTIDVVSNGLNVTWNPVNNIPMDSYEVIVMNQDDQQDFVTDWRVTKNTRSVFIDKSFFQHNKNYELEVLARAVNGNQVKPHSSVVLSVLSQTISLTHFVFHSVIAEHV